MFKKRHLFILIVLLLVIAAVILFEVERYRTERFGVESDKIIAVCRDTLLVSKTTVPEELKYENMVYYPWRDYVYVTFRYGGSKAFCHVLRNGSTWEVYGAGYLLGPSSIP